MVKATVDDDAVLYSYEIIKGIADYLQNRTSVRPKVGIICGTGLKDLVETLKDRQDFDHASIPNFPVATGSNRIGRMSFGHLEDVPVVCLQGRFHYYEGYSLAKCSMPIRVMKLLGVEYLIATNAAGSVNPNYKIGDIMIALDHINWMGWMGTSPLRGPNDARFGPRFPSVLEAYTPALVAKAQKVAASLGIQNDVKVGVYTQVGGPAYETIVELKMLHTAGVDAVGMSTVNEVITATHCGMKVFAFSLITEKCPLDYQIRSAQPSHQTVTESRLKVCQDFLLGFLREIKSEIKEIN